jgi:hypothetical protein
VADGAQACFSVDSVDVTCDASHCDGDASKFLFVSSWAGVDAFSGVGFVEADFSGDGFG